MQKTIKTKIMLSIALVFLGIMGFGQGNLPILPPKTIQGWIYPGAPACNAHQEFKDGRKIDVLKVEYYHLCNNTDNGGGNAGNLVRVDLAPVSGNPDWSNLCNGYSLTNSAEIQNSLYSSARFITISGGIEGMSALFGSSTKKTNFKSTIISFLTNSLNQNFTGVELDFECDWDNKDALWSDYKDFIQYLGTELHNINKLLIIDGPPIKHPSGNNSFRYSYFKNNSYVDYVCVMGYDYDMTHKGEAISPIDWVSDITDYVIEKMSKVSSNPNNPNEPEDLANIKKIIIGMPSYSYYTKTNDDVKNITKELASGQANYDIVNNARDINSHERYFNGPTSITSSTYPRWYYLDAEGMSKKIELIRAKGIKHISVWHLGGNDWFNRFNVKLNNDIVDANFKLPNKYYTVAKNWINDNYVSNYNLVDATSVNQCATVDKFNISNGGGNEIILGGYNFGVPVDATLSSFEIAIIGHSNPASEQLKSRFSIEVFNGTSYSVPYEFDIYSSHDIIKMINNNLWGLSWDARNLINKFKIRIKLISGESAFLNAVFVKAIYTSTSCYGYTGGAVPFNILFPGTNVKEITSPYSTIFGLEITAGKTLIVKSKYNVWTINGPIIVKPGGKLIIDGGTITSYCEKYLWQGVIVEGDANYSQFDENHQGVVQIINGGTIRNAICGIKTRCTSDANKGGGIIKANNANFINNQIAVKMQQFQNKTTNGSNFVDLSYFRLCNFTSDNSYPQPDIYPFRQFVELNKVNGLEMKACKFDNNTTNLPVNYYASGMGIVSINSTFTVDRYYDPATGNQRNCEFNMLKYGIKAISDDISLGFSVKNTIFAKNMYGAYAQGMNNISFISNDFRIVNFASQISTAPDAYGLYLNNCKKGYSIEGNSFSKADAASSDASIGILINSSEGDVKTIYNNSFSNIRYAFLAQNDNGGNLMPANGLKIKCNDFAVNYRDIAITPDYASGISPVQGSNIFGDSKSPAGNTFTHLGPTGTPTDFNNRAANLPIYYHHQGSENDPWVPKYYYKIDPEQVNGAVYNKALACPNIAIPSSGNLDPLYINTERQAKRQLLNSAKLIYTIWVDGGNTQALKEAVDLSYPWQAYELYNNLISKSPYLSDEVIISAIENEEGLPALMLKLVLLANPQATRSSKVWDALYARHNPLPDSWIDEIKQGIEIISPRTELEANIGYYAGQYQQYTDVLKNYYLSDTTESATDSLIAVLSNTGSASDAYELAMVYLNNGRVDDGVQLLENMPNTNILQSEEEIYRYYQTMSYFNIIKKIKSDNFRYGDLSQQELDWIYLTSENDDAPYSGNAKAIRMMYEDNYEYYEPVYYPNEEEMRKAKHKPGETISKSLILMPNPAKDYTIVNYSISEILTAEACIEIYDALGRMQSRTPISRQSGEELIDCSQMGNGSYLLILKNNGKTINKAKFVVTH